VGFKRFISSACYARFLANDSCHRDDLDRAARDFENVIYLYVANSKRYVDAHCGYCAANANHRFYDGGS
jgi:hypothetical protein